MLNALARGEVADDPEVAAEVHQDAVRAPARGARRPPGRRRGPCRCRRGRGGAPGRQRTRRRRVELDPDAAGRGPGRARRRREARCRPRRRSVVAAASTTASSTVGSKRCRRCAAQAVDRRASRAKVSGSTRTPPAVGWLSRLTTLSGLEPAPPRLELVDAAAGLDGPESDVRQDDEMDVGAHGPEPELGPAEPGQGRVVGRARLAGEGRFSCRRSWWAAVVRVPAPGPGPGSERSPRRATRARG